MPLKNIQIKASKRSKIVDPLQLFNSLTLRGGIENIWQPQAEALKDWHKHRADADVVIEMNTGGGKTLVGVLIAQSLTNESGGKVLYVCPTNQLVEQAYARAREVSITPAMYTSEGWTNKESYEQGRTFCLTNYAAVFNGISVFRKQGISALVFDDAHVSTGQIRGAYTVKIKHSHPAFDHLAKLLRPHFEKSSQWRQYDSAVSGGSNAVLFLPMYEVNSTWRQITKVLEDAKTSGDGVNTWAWSHLKDYIDRCTVLIGPAGFEISPAGIPTSTSPYFADDVRRVYLTATLPSAAEFLRTFGTAPVRIRPRGKLGDSQRLFVFVPGDSDDDQRAEAKELVAGLKACIITPSGKNAEAWKDTAKVFGGAHGEIEKFSKSKKPEKLILTARYDGIDFPGDACRVLVLDKLPVGKHLLDRFLDESIQARTLRSATTAIRIVQAIGRIFRGNSDHGVVVLCGSELQSWLKSPQNLAFLPPLIQQQIRFALELRDNVDDGKVTYEELIEGALKGSDEWDEVYNDSIEKYESDDLAQPPEWVTSALAIDHDAFQQLWQGDFQSAARTFGGLADSCALHEHRLAAWYSHFQGFCLERVGDTAGAFSAYRVAANSRGELGRPTIAKLPKPVESQKISDQARQIATNFRSRRSWLESSLKAIPKDLKYGPDTRPAEEALKVLGQLLGLDASRPDNEFKTGPDVIWIGGDKAIAVLEAKTDKKESGIYRKKSDIGQFHDHLVWVTGKYPKRTLFKYIVGYHLPVSKESNPPEDLAVLELEEFLSLHKRVAEMYEQLSTSSSVERQVEGWLELLGLKWPVCVHNLASKLAVDLKSVDEHDAD